METEVSDRKASRARGEQYKDRNTGRTHGFSKSRTANSSRNITTYHGSTSSATISGIIDQRDRVFTAGTPNPASPRDAFASSSIDRT